MTPARTWLLAANAVLLLAAAGCSGDEPGHDDKRLCLDGSKPLASTGVCTNAGEAGDPCENDWDCVPGSICFDASYCVGAGTLRVTLSFDVDSDFDLHVVTPHGNELHYATPIADGGELDVDQCVDPCGAGPHVENVVFADTAPSGSYQLFVVNYDGRAGGPFRIEVATDHGTQELSGELPATEGAESQRFDVSL